MQEILGQILWEKCGGLIPAIAQDYQTKEVLMLGFMNKEALELSLESGFVHYFSRSKGRIWQKGEQSGHVQKIHAIALDCDKDSILINIEQIGVACHTGKRSCFFNVVDSKENKIKPNLESRRDSNINAIYGAVDVLYHTLLERKGANPETSYTAKLYHKGENTIAKKIVEEAAELGFAIKDNIQEEIIYEATDLLYHSLVGLAHRNISPDLIRQELLKRFGLSGIDEKNMRK